MVFECHSTPFRNAFEDTFRFTILNVSFCFFGTFRFADYKLPAEPRAAS